MNIGKCLNAKVNEILDKRFNIYIGISLGNKYFTKDIIREYIIWGLKNTKDSLAILIPDKIHAINYEVRNGYSVEKSLRLAMRKGKEVRIILESVLDDLDTIQRNRVEILVWEDIEDSKHAEMVDILCKEFEKNIIFHSEIIDIVKEIFPDKKYSVEEYRRLTGYVLHELPILIRGIETNRGKMYNLVPYPGLSRVDYLAVDLQNGEEYPELTKKLNLKTKCILLEVYAKGK